MEEAPTTALVNEGEGFVEIAINIGGNPAKWAVVDLGGGDGGGAYGGAEHGGEVVHLLAHLRTLRLE